MNKKSLFILISTAIFLNFCVQTPTKAGNGLKIAWTTVCRDYGGVQLFALTDGTVVSAFTNTDPWEMATIATMMTIWAGNKTITAYTVDGQPGDNCGGITATQLTMVTAG